MTVALLQLALLAPPFAHASPPAIEARIENAAAQSETSSPPDFMFWFLGKHLSMSVLLNAKGGQQASIDDGLSKAGRLADALGFRLPDIPARTGDGVEDIVNAIGFYTSGDGGALKQAIEMKYDQRVASIYEMTARTTILLLTYGPDGPTEGAVSSFERAATRSQLPSRLWSPVGEVASSGAPMDEVTSAVVKTYSAIEEHIRPPR